MDIENDTSRTGAEICEEYVKWAGLNMTGEQFWDSDPSGHLLHVFAARESMDAAGHFIPKLQSEASKVRGK